MTRLNAMTGQSDANVGYKVTKRPINDTERANFKKLDDMFRKILRAFAVITIFLAIVNLLFPICLIVILTGIFSLIPFVIMIVYFKLRKKGMQAMAEGIVIEISGVVMSSGPTNRKVYLIGPISFPWRPNLDSMIVEGRPATMGFFPHLNYMATLDNLPMTNLISVKVPKGFMESIASQPVVTPSEVQQAVVAQPAPAQTIQAPEAPQPAPATAAKAPSADMRVSIGGSSCPKCRASCDSNDLFCKKCGAPLK